MIDDLAAAALLILWSIVWLNSEITINDSKLPKWAHYATHYSIGAFHWWLAGSLIWRHLPL